MARMSAPCWLIYAVVAALFIACGGDTGGSASATPTVASFSPLAPTRAPAVATSPAALTVTTGNPTATSAATVADVTPATAVPIADTPTARVALAPHLTGRASVTDPAGDFVDADATTPEWSIRHFDLVGAMVVGDSSMLTVTFEVVDYVLLEVREAACRYKFVITLDSTDAYELIFSIGISGARMNVFDVETSEFTAVNGEPVISNGTLTASFPAELIPRVEGPFLWHASTDCLDMIEFKSWSDRVPDTGFVPFPQFGPTPSPTPQQLGDITGPTAEVEVRNYMSVPNRVELVGVGSFVAQPGQYEWKLMPAGTWSYIQSADGYTPLEGEITWEEGGRHFWELYDGDEVEIVEIQNNLGVPMTLEFDGWGELWVDAGSSVSRAFPPGEYEYSFTAEGYNDVTRTVRMDAGARTIWPFNPS